MADDKLKTGPESPVLDHPGGGPAGDAQAVTKPPVPEEVEGLYGVKYALQDFMCS